MRRRDLHAAGAEFAVDVVVGDDRNFAIAQRQHHGLADQMLVALVLRMYGHGGVAEHGFRARCRDDDVVARFAGFGLVAQAASERVAQMPELAVFFFLHHFQIGDRGLQHRVPVDQALAAIDQAVFVQAHEVFDDGLGIRRVHREGVARPVHAAAEPADLVFDGAAGVLFPSPDLVDEFLARHVRARLAFELEIALHDHLRGDAGVVGAGLPQRVVAEHAVVAGQRIHDGVLEGVSHMQRAGDVRRRDHDRVRAVVCAAQALRGEPAAAFPGVAPTRLDAVRIEGFFH